MKKQNKLLCFALGASILLSPLNAYALKKSETIYTNLNYDGTVTKSTVSNHLSFIGNSDIDDVTELSNIMNLKGDEKFTLNDGKLTWSSLGNDIFYNGVIEKNLPIKTTVTYYLNDEERDVKDMIGKSGHVKIIYRFTNDNKNYVSINGHMETLYTPFLTSVGTILKDDTKNVEISNGKIINTGSRSVALGIASPGLYASTKINEFSNMDSVIISYDTDKFELGTTYIISTPKLLENSDMSFLDKTNTLSKSIDKLENNMQKLVDGAKQLELGATDLATGSNTLMTSLASAATSIEQLKQGSIALDAGVNKMIQELNNAKALLADSTNSNMASIATLINQNTVAINSYYTALSSAGINMSEVASACAGTSHTELLANSDISMFCLLNANNTALNSVSLLLSNNIDTILKGLTELKNGSATLTNGMTQMESGLNALYAGSKNLSSGADELKNGATTLNLGATTFKEQGIDRLASTTSNLVTYTDRVKALANLSKNYKGYASTNSNETVFIAMIPSYKK